MPPQCPTTTIIKRRANSKVVMARLRVSRAFSFDRHFRQFGSIDVAP
jgi:hypothetical protein